MEGKKAHTGKLLVLLIIPLLILGVLVRLSTYGSSDSRQVTAIIVLVAIVGVIGFIAVLLRRSDRTVETTGDEDAVNQQLDSEQGDRSKPTREAQTPPLGRPSVKAVMHEALAKKQRREAEESLAREEHRLAETLGRYKCFYKHNEEMLGPVTLWQVREMIEADLFDPDVQVILEGSDYWYTYAEQELRVAPPRSGSSKALHAAAKLQCDYLLGDKIHGPVSLLVIFHKIRLGELPADVQIRAKSSEAWRRASDV